MAANGEADADVKIRMEALGTEETAKAIEGVNAEVVAQAKAREAEAKATKAEADAEAAQVKSKAALAKAAEAAARALEQERRATEALSKAKIVDTSGPARRDPAEVEASRLADVERRRAAGAGKSSSLASDPRQMLAEEAAAKREVTAAARAQEQAEQDLLDLKVKQEQEEQGLKDLQEVRSRAAKRNAEAEKSDVKELTQALRAAQISQYAASFVSHAREMGRSLEGLNDESAKSLQGVATGVETLGSVMEMGAKGFSVGGPFGAAVGAFIGLLSGPLNTAFTEMNDQIKATAAAEKAAADSVKKLARARAEFATQVREERLAETFREELHEVDKMTESYARQKAMREAAAAANTEVRNAVTGGTAGKILGTADQAQDGKVADQVREAGERLQAAGEALVIAGKKAEVMAEKAADTANFYGKNAEATKAAEAAKVQAEEDRQRAEADNAAALSIYQDQMAAIEKTNQVARLQEGNDKLVEKIGAIVDEATQSGVLLTKAGAEAAQELKGMIDDHAVSAAEMKKLPNLLATLMANMQGATVDLIGVINQTQDKQREQQKQIEALQHQLAHH
jgi:hypothetical protein